MLFHCQMVFMKDFKLLEGGLSYEFLQLFFWRHQVMHQFLKFSLLLATMNENWINPCIRTDKPKNNRDLPKTLLFISLKKSFSKSFFSYTLTSAEVDIVYQPWQVIKRQNMMGVTDTDTVSVSSTTLNCGSGWYSLLCCINSGRAWWRFAKSFI